MREMTYGLDVKEVQHLVQSLIRIRTPHPDCNELDIVKYVLSLFEDYEVEKRVVHHGDNRASLVIVIKGSDPSGGTAFVGHIDTVDPPYPKSWVHPPYAADFEDDRIYGNGASNAKSGVAAMIAAALYLLRNGIRPQKDAYFCFTADGDGDGIGAASLCDGGFLDNASEAIFADPTDAQIGIAQKGVLWLEVTARGYCKHVLEADRSVDPLRRILHMSSEIESMLCRVPQHALLGKSKVHITGVNTGYQWTCIIPEAITATLDIRYSPLMKESSIMEELENIAAREMREYPDLTVEIKKLISRNPIGIAPDAPIVRRVDACFTRLGRKPTKMGLGFYSDSSKIVPRLGIPFVLLGPGNWIYTDRGDESVSLDATLFVSNVYIDYLTQGTV